MSRCKPMYDLDGKAVETLRTRYRKIAGDHEWSCVEEFIKWANDSGFKKNARIYKKDENKPHGPNNSCWTILGQENTRRRFTDQLKYGSVFCADCKRDCPSHGHGCNDWKAYFKDNWNQNIYVPPVKPVVQEGPMVFRYEHPDLVREGITFER